MKLNKKIKKYSKNIPYKIILIVVISIFIISGIMTNVIDSPKLFGSGVLENNDNETTENIEESFEQEGYQDDKSN